jgi:Arc/MetJ-type ribon-helix-helix transcriptional regulator
MTIHVSQDVEKSIDAAVQSGKFASADEMITTLVREYERSEQPARASKPIWEEFQEISASVPDEVWDALPSDLAEQHDHYIYGTPKNTDA